VFGDSHRKMLNIPRLVNDYNHHMGGVDIADQLRQYYSTQMRTLRNWFPLFLWLLDTAVINAYIMRSIHLYRKTPKGSHREFRLCLIQQLQELAQAEEMNLEITITRAGAKRARSGSTQQPEKEEETVKSNRPDSYVTKHHHSLDPARFSSGPHLPSYVDNRLNCVWCAVQDKIQGIPHRRIRTNVVCSSCNIPLCFKTTANCYSSYHQP
jgi:hypothetical protein